MIWSDKKIQLSEFKLDSSPNNIESEIKVPDDVNSILNELESRHEVIMYTLSNGIFLKKLSTKYLETLLKPIRYEAAHSALNSMNEHEIGFQYKTKLSESAISDFQFDAVLCLNSTRRYYMYLSITIS